MPRQNGPDRVAGLVAREPLLPPALDGAVRPPTTRARQDAARRDLSQGRLNLRDRSGAGGGVERNRDGPCGSGRAARQGDSLSFRHEMNPGCPTLVQATANEKNVVGE